MVLVEGQSLILPDNVGHGREGIFCATLNPSCR
jgi:hypothetical protein